MAAALESLIQELPETERPRERLLEQGSQALSDAELLAVLLRSGRPGCSAIQLARELLRDAGGLGGLPSFHPRALRRLGLGAAKAASVLAALELGRRVLRSQIPERDPLTRPNEVASYLAFRYRTLDQEVVGALFLDSRNRLMGEKEIFRGTLSRAAVEPREILKEGLLRGAAGILLFHTHPSGDPSPSTDDLLFTRRLAEAGEVVGVRLVDHMILGAAGRWVSLHQRGAC
ncbi:MAG TPA: DNA repair protein RadC [Thermoanaerobaculia bacterium]|nr:DNA repair protein RadC [Thermoanaerobaculia bacterium]